MLRERSIGSGQWVTGSYFHHASNVFVNDTIASVPA